MLIILLERYTPKNDLDKGLTIVYTLGMKTVINIKTDKEVKRDAKKVAEDLGFSLSAVINAYLRQFARNKEVYFSLIPQMSFGLEKLLGQAEVDIKKKKNVSPAFSSEKELKKHLNSL